MYQIKDRKYAITAMMYYVAMFIGYFGMGLMYRNGIKYYSVIYWLFLAIAVLIVLINDKSLFNLGFSKEKIKSNLLIAGIIVVIAIGSALLYTNVYVIKILKSAAYYMFYIALFEEMIFRGFIQNYLFGFHIDKKVVYIVGALCFSLLHLPFQMFVNDMVSVSYIIVAAPQLIFTFLFHLLMCYITYERKDILISTALHFAIDFVQAVF
jgi:membrane protein